MSEAPAFGHGVGFGEAALDGALKEREAGAAGSELAAAMQRIGAADGAGPVGNPGAIVHGRREA